jgi:hypothetical protein
MPALSKVDVDHVKRLEVDVMTLVRDRERHVIDLLGKPDQGVDFVKVCVHPGEPFKPPNSDPIGWSNGESTTRGVEGDNPDDTSVSIKACF